MSGNFNALASSVQQKVAVKIFLREDSSEYVDEVKMLRAVGVHANIVKLVHKYDQTPSTRCAILLSLAEKGSLSSILEERALPAVMVVQYGLQIAEGLLHIHRRNIVHFDIKAANILVDKRNIALIADFGIASWFTGDDSIVLGCGTLNYLAPEGIHALGRKSDASKMDVYSFGMVLYEMLSGLVPYENLWRPDMDNDAWTSLLSNHKINGVHPGIDPRWCSATVKLMRQCWKRDPDRRLSSLEVVNALTSIV